MPDARTASTSSAPRVPRVSFCTYLKQKRNLRTGPPRDALPLGAILSEWPGPVIPPALDLEGFLRHRAEERGERPHVTLTAARASL